MHNIGYILYVFTIFTMKNMALELLKVTKDHPPPFKVSMQRYRSRISISNRVIAHAELKLIAEKAMKKVLFNCLIKIHYCQTILPMSLT